MLLTFETFRELCETRFDDVVGNIVICRIHQPAKTACSEYKESEKMNIKEVSGKWLKPTSK